MGAGATALAAVSDAAAEPPRPVLRFAHLTDTHVNGERRSVEGFMACLEHAKRHDPAPQFILTGGDHIMDALEASHASVEAQWKLYTSALAAGTRLPVHPVMGNHDVWGWANSGLTGNEPGYGKAMALDRLGIARPYYSLHRAGWRIIILDNNVRRGLGYYGGLDDAQNEWLKGELKSAGTMPVCIVSHIPLLAACAFFDGKERVRDTYWHVPDAWMHRDVKPLLLQLREANTRLCISGHIHLRDRVEYLGMNFVCDGAVCGGWWRGPYQECDAGYGLFDLYADGTFTHQYVTYGWKAEPAPAE